ncbi:hypothetical protein HLB23_18395 [Nocardia uniformis]|uniref:Glycolipid-binding domain-containing protein n=2 Tax=Nocardia uniformis TaxID=53432 RepID=A0A849C633_9NOCA|nr:hypothetical protein [Nocardia uniformis]
MAAWRHCAAREGFEVTFLRATSTGMLINGSTTAIEGGRGWTVEYSIALDSEWRTRHAQVAVRHESSRESVRLAANGVGSWTVNGIAAPALDGCVDIDLEASACTNALPIHRLSIGVGEEVDAPAAYVHLAVPKVTRLEQRYHRIPDDGARHRFDYRAPEFDYSGVLVYDASGLIVDYPGLAVRQQ